MYSGRYTDIHGLLSGDIKYIKKWLYCLFKTSTIALLKIDEKTNKTWPPSLMKLLDKWLNFLKAQGHP